MDKDREILHKVLDDEATEEEQNLLASRMEADPELRDELGGITGAVVLLEKSGRVQAPRAFTQEVMRRLPSTGPAWGQRVYDFFFAGRMLRWNMASAFAVAAVLMVTVIVAVQQQRVPGGSTQLSSSNAEQVVTVRLNFHAPEAQRVSVAGDFNKWQVDAQVMERRSGGVWTAEITLKPGLYNYMFVVDGKAWIADPGAESYQDDGFGAKNAVMRVSI